MVSRNERLCDVRRDLVITGGAELHREMRRGESGGGDKERGGGGGGDMK